MTGVGYPASKTWVSVVNWMVRALPETGPAEPPLAPHLLLYYNVLEHARCNPSTCIVDSSLHSRLHRQKDSVHPVGTLP